LQSKQSHTKQETKYCFEKKNIQVVFFDDMVVVVESGRRTFYFSYNKQQKQREGSMQQCNG